MLDREIPSFGAILDARHAVIFVASGHQVRTVIDEGHVDYAMSRGLYDRLRTPRLPDLWPRFASGELDERDLFNVLAEELTGPSRVPKQR